MNKDDLDFFTKTTGFTWYFELESKLKELNATLIKIKSVASFYDYNTKSNLIVNGIINMESENKLFKAFFNQSEKWFIPGESIYNLDRIELN